MTHHAPSVNTTQNTEVPLHYLPRDGASRFVFGVKSNRRALRATIARLPGTTFNSEFDIETSTTLSEIGAVLLAAGSTIIICHK